MSYPNFWLIAAAVFICACVLAVYLNKRKRQKAWDARTPSSANTLQETNITELETKFAYACVFHPSRKAVLRIKAQGGCGGYLYYCDRCSVQQGLLTVEQAANFKSSGTIAQLGIN